METGNLDRDKEFAVVDSTEEFETQGTPTSDEFEPAVTDFETQENPSGTDYDGHSQEPENSVTEPEVSHDLSEPSGVDIPQNPEQEKTPSQQSFRVMRFEDFVNRSGN